MNDKTSSQAHCTDSPFPLPRAFAVPESPGFGGAPRRPPASSEQPGSQGRQERVPESSPSPWPPLPQRLLPLSSRFLGRQRVRARAWEGVDRVRAGYDGPLATTPRVGGAPQPAYPGFESRAGFRDSWAGRARWGTSWPGQRTSGWVEEARRVRSDRLQLCR